MTNIRTFERMAQSPTPHNRTLTETEQAAALSPNSGAPIRERSARYGRAHWQRVS